MLRCFCSQLNGLKKVTLNGSESRHLISVLRANKRTEVELIDGCGTVARGYVENFDKSAAQIAIETTRRESRHFHLSLIQAVLTNSNTEFILREACAIGVSKICILQAERSESKIRDKLDTKLTHWTKLLIEGCKQSGNPFLPELSFAKNVETLSADGSIAKFFGNISVSARYLIRELQPISKPCDITVAIGPEGDFSDREKEIFSSKNFVGCRLSSNVLRSETAAIYALSVIDNYMNSIC